MYVACKGLYVAILASGFEMANRTKLLSVHVREPEAVGPTEDAESKAEDTCVEQLKQALKVALALPEPCLSVLVSAKEGRTQIEVFI